MLAVRGTGVKAKKKRKRDKKANMEAARRKKRLRGYYDEAEAFCKEWEAEHPGKKCRGKKAISLKPAKWPGISAYALNSRLDKKLQNFGRERSDRLLLTSAEREDLAEVNAVSLHVLTTTCHRQCDKVHWQGMLSTERLEIWQWPTFFGGEMSATSRVEGASSNCQVLQRKH